MFHLFTAPPPPLISLEEIKTFSFMDYFPLRVNCFLAKHIIASIKLNIDFLVEHQKDVISSIFFALEINHASLRCHTVKFLPPNYKKTM